MSDLIGFVLLRHGRQRRRPALDNTSATPPSPVLDQGRDAVVPIILDGEKCWEYYPGSGREFLRPVYDALPKSGIEAVTVSEAN